MKNKKEIVFSMILALLVLTGCETSKDSGADDDGSGGMGAVDEVPEGGHGGNPLDDGSVGGMGGSGDTFEVPETYQFESVSMQNESSVDYSGQTFRHVLIAGLAGALSFLDILTLNGSFDSSEELGGNLYTFFCFGEATDLDGRCPSPDIRKDMPGGIVNQEDRPIFFVPSGLNRQSLRQGVYGDIASGKNLIGKLAGNDSATNPENYWTENFEGWETDDVGSPEDLIHWFFAQVVENTRLRLQDTERPLPFRPADGDGSDEVLPIFVSEDGLDYQQLIQKFLLGAIAFHQCADDYLDNDPNDGDGNKGLLSSNAVSADSHSTSLEHAWDEGFGYFGAARDYNDYTDDEIAASGGRAEYQNGYHDSNGDERIDFLSEVNFGASVNAAKRDRGSDAIAPTDFTKDAFDAFLKGRAIIRHAASRGEDSALTADEMVMLIEERDKAISAWEKAISATAVHYINDVIQDMNTFAKGQVEQPNFSFRNLAKHWSEMKGFALSFQFNPRSPMHEAHMDGVITRNQKFQALVGTRPVVPSTDDNTYAQRAEYIAALLEARDILQTAYDFAPENMGDENGENGW